jgi:hypothetical protein
MKTEYLVECYERPGMDDFFLIVSLKNKNVFLLEFLKILKKRCSKKKFLIYSYLTKLNVLKNQKE